MYLGIYARPNTEKTPYKIPTTPPRPRVPQRAISAADQPDVLVPFNVGINTLANIMIPSVIAITPVTNGLPIVFHLVVAL